MGSINCQRNPLIILEEALQAGITMFQFREKGKNALKGEAYIQFAQQCQQLCKSYRVPFIVNDDVALAIKLNADGIHVGQDDLRIELFYQQMPNKIIGVSTHSLEQIIQAIRNGADYVGIGPIFETSSKDDAEPPAGLEFLQQVRESYPHLPIVAIGGITPENSDGVRQAGANGVAVISAISKSDDIRKTVLSL